MLVVMRRDATDSQIQNVVDRIGELGYEAKPIRGAQRTAVGIVGNDGRIDAARLSSLDAVQEIVHVSPPYKQASREWRPDNTVVPVGASLVLGGDEVAIAAGPCAVESEQQITEIAHVVRDAGASLLRGGAFKPRTSPYAFQGLGKRALTYLARAAEATGLPVVTEVMDTDHTEVVAEHCSLVQVGARNMQNYPLLKRLGRCGKPVLLKRGMSATVAELLLAAEYLLTSGNGDIVLCERGVRGFDPGTRNILDLSAVPLIKQLSHLPVIVDPSHGTGVRDFVTPMALAAVAAGADGIMVEVHTDPTQALSDGAQSLYPEQFRALVDRANQVANAVGRQLAAPLSIGMAP